MILSINPGSSSLKYKLFDASFNVVAKDDISLDENFPTHEAALNKILQDIEVNLSQIEKIAIRVVHGGPKFKEISSLSEEVISEIKKYSVFAPLHNPPALSTISALLDKFDKEKLYVVFDTGFFNSLPKEAYTYPIGPVNTALPIKRYGFHGISHKYMQENVDPSNIKKVITIHLGAGCSISATNKGQVVATSMGLTPDGGLVMQTRGGDLDPGLVLYLAKEIGLEDTKKLIETKSGLSGMTNTDGNMLDILELAGEKIVGAEFATKYEKTEEAKEKSLLALKIYTNSIAEHVGGYSALMGGLDAIVFSGKIGAGSPVIRDKVLSHLNFLGDIEIKIVEPDEELAMAREVSKIQSN